MSARILVGVLLVMHVWSQSLAAQRTVVEAIDVAPVWAGHPVGLALLTHGDRQFVAFYDAQRRMTVASRPLDSRQWTFQVLPSNLGWDSHNYVTMAIDEGGLVHLAGNMHGHPLIYFRTARPLDVTSFERIEQMVGREEQRMTYPKFLRGPAGELIFTYRDGGSGNGNQIYNVYDPATRAWSRLLDRPLTDGQGRMNAYFHGPVRGPDGFFHLVWVWRDTGDCATNHDLCYARSGDLRRWQTSAGRPLELPITIDSAEVIDPVPPGGGMINGNTVIGFDLQKRPVISYHKFDPRGNTQLYNARLEEGRWVIYQSSDWDYRWAFSGGGSIIFEIRLRPVKVAGDEMLTQSWTHVKYGSQTWRLDPGTLKPLGTVEPAGAAGTAELERVESDFPGMQVRWQSDSGRSDQKGVSYRLRWETLPHNRDRPRPEPWPQAGMLRVYRIAMVK